MVRDDDGERAYGEGLSVFGLVCDVLALRQLYKPHRNGDAIRGGEAARQDERRSCACGGVFASADKYRDAIQILDEEPSVCLFSQ